MENSIADIDKGFSFDSPDSIKAINRVLNEGLTGLLGITVTAVRPGFVEAGLTVDKKVSRPGGYMHGGVNLTLAETLAGLGSTLLIDSGKYNAMGIQVSANHIASMQQGELTAQASLLHQGEKTHLWNIEVMDNRQRCISSIRVTNMIVEKR